MVYLFSNETQLGRPQGRTENRARTFSGGYMGGRMKRTRILIALVMIVLLGMMPGALAATWNDDNGNGIIDYKESGELVAMLQTRLRELGFFNFKSTGNYQSMTRNAVIEFQKVQQDGEGNPFIADGTVGEQSKGTLFSAAAVRAPIPADVHLPIGKSADGSQTQTGRMATWSEMHAALVVGETYTLTDYNTGVTFDIIYTGGEQHAEVECASANDTTVYREAFGAEFNYSKRPMLVTVNGEFIACSLQGQPHGEDIVERNEMDGHACLFFHESKSHVGGLSDTEHTNNIYTAAGNQS